MGPKKKDKKKAKAEEVVAEESGKVASSESLKLLMGSSLHYRV